MLYKTNPYKAVSVLQQNNTTHKGGERGKTQKQNNSVSK